jgi:hypothetical protein
MTILSLPKNKLVVFSDMDDVLLLPSISAIDIIEAFDRLVKESRGPLVFFTAEPECYPDLALKKSYPPTSLRSLSPHEEFKQSPFPYLNAGILIGKAGHLVEMIRLTYTGDCFDDQLQFTNSFLDPLVWWNDKDGETHYESSKTLDSKTSHILKNKLIGLDYWNVLFGSLVDMQLNRNLTLDPDSQRITFIGTQGQPMILHQNGDKSVRQAIEVLSKEIDLPFNSKIVEITP